MPAEIKKEIQLEIAHVLFIDIVGYSKLSVNEQHAAVEELNQIVRAAEQFQKAEAASRLLKIPTGDGMALVFYTSPEAPAQCAVEIARALKREAGPSSHRRDRFHEVREVARAPTRNDFDAAIKQCRICSKCPLA
jgi:class 3 adenylate cyclase